MRLIRKFCYYKFIFSHSLEQLEFSPKGSSELLIVTIAYNNSEFIFDQIRLLRKYVKDEFAHCVVDNSSEVSVRSKIRKACFENEVSYYSIPNNPYRNNKSHAAAMHWAFFQVIRKKNCGRFGFLDHDIFPISSFSFANKFKQGVYGRVVHSYFPGGYSEECTSDVPYWCLWAGFCFFEKRLIKGYFPWSFNFFSKHFPKGYFLDTGGGLWNALYSKMDYPGSIVTYQKKYFGDSDVTEMQNQSFEILDDAWIHFVSLSNWRETEDLEGKKERLENFLNDFI